MDGNGDMASASGSCVGRFESNALSSLRPTPTPRLATLPVAPGR